MILAWASPFKLCVLSRTVYTAFWIWKLICQTSSQHYDSFLQSIQSQLETLSERWCCNVGSVSKALAWLYCSIGSVLAGYLSILFYWTSFASRGSPSRSSSKSRWKHMKLAILRDNLWKIATHISRIAALLDRLHAELVNPFSAGTVFRRQNLTSTTSDSDV